MVRWDVNLTTKQSLFAHYYLNQNQNRDHRARLQQQYRRLDVTEPGTSRPERRHQSYLHDLAHALSQLTLGFTRSYSLDTPTVTRLPSELGIQGMPMYTDGGSPQFTVTGRFRWTPAAR